MKKLILFIFLFSLCASWSARADTGVGLFVGKPYWGFDVNHNGFRVNVSLDDRFGLGANKTFPISGTPMYVFIGGQYVDRDNHFIAVTPGIGAEFRVKPVGFYFDLVPAIYLDELDLELEAKAGFRIYF
ncbi:hypothetical protein [Vibrio ishigakensis]|nr:hypothetical protein [Vibrio ishigakensis]